MNLAELNARAPRERVIPVRDIADPKRIVADAILCPDRTKTGCQGVVPIDRWRARNGEWHLAEKPKHGETVLRTCDRCGGTWAIRNEG